MPRNGSGGYSLDPSTWNPGVDGVTATTTDWNVKVKADLETAIAGSLATDGQSTMSGALKMGNQRITGVADGVALTDAATISQIGQWTLYSGGPTFISATSFSLAGDLTATFEIGRRIKSTNTGGTIYSTISNSVFGAVTTVTVVNDSGALDAGLSVVYYGLLSVANPSIPETTVGKALRTAATVAAGQTAIGVQDLRWGMTSSGSLTAAGAFSGFSDETNQNAGGGNSAAGGTYTAPVTGVYIISATFTITGTPSATGVVSAGIAVGGTAIGTNASINIGTGDIANLIRVMTVSTTYRLAAGEIVTCRNNGTNPASLSTQCTRFRGALIRQSS